MDSWYLDNLACPRDRTSLTVADRELVCLRSHRYPIVDGVPVMLLDDVEQTLGVAESSLRLAQLEPDSTGLYLDSVGINAEEKRGVVAMAATGAGRVDPVVAYLIAATSGSLYKAMLGKLSRYPIPDLPLANGNNEDLLDVGCNWGRWSIAAARRGWNVVGIDPSLGAVMSARRVAQSMGLPIRYVVADGRFLPFPPNRFKAVYSFGVLQHLSRENVGAVLSEMARVLVPAGTCLVQMPNNLGLRSMYQQARRRFRQPMGFEVRYWRIRDLRATFGRAMGGTTQVSVDAFGGLGIHNSDSDLMSPSKKLLIAGSEALKKISRALPFFVYFADSVYVRSIKAPNASTAA
jgi:SAM-dependent methyltransferase/uncharacterized protein YbaR (Trm112 family)